MKSATYLLPAFLVLAFAAGCSYESRDTTLHDPGVYKGGEDPLLLRQHEQELIDRLKLVQTDR